MDNNQIYQKCWDKAVQRTNGLSFFKYKRALFWDKYGDESERASECIASSDTTARRKSSSKSKKQEISLEEKTLGSVSMAVHPDVHEHTLSGGERSLCRRPIDEFRDLFSGTIYTEDISWEDCEVNPKLQSRLYSVLDRGIIRLINIPKIPLEYEPDSKVQFYGFDSEDNSCGAPHFFQFATRDYVYIATSFRLLMRYVIQTHRLNRQNNIVWGTNIEYDLGNLLKDWDVTKDSCDLKWTKGGLKKFEIEYDPANLTWAGKEDIKGMIKVWDTLNHWRMGVKDIGKILTTHIGYDFNKLEQDFYGLKYSAMDAILSRSYACVQKKYYDNKGIALKFTPGATTLNFYMRGHSDNGDLFCKHKLFDTHTDEELQWLIEGLRGGRTEVFSLKEYRGRIGYFDINSAYPYSMKFGIFPHPSRHQWINGHDKIEKMIRAGFEGMVECVVDTLGCSEFVKVIPYLGTIEKKTGRYIFPLGSWTGKYTVFEIKKARALGYHFNFKQAVMYEPTRYQPFSDFVDFCYKIRDEGTAKNDRILRDIGKSLGNNLYGKFGQRLRFTSLENPDNYKPEDIEDCIRIGQGVLIEKDQGFAPHSNVIWSVYITAICRDLLYNHMLAAWANGNEVLYCDTDSIFIHGGKWPDSDQTKLGALKHEGDLSLFRAILPKTYIYETGEKTCYKAKGVKDSEQKTFITRGKVEFKKPLKIREALRRKNFKDPTMKQGMSSVNAWVTVTKELKGKYTKRLVNADGSTTPIVLS